MINFKESDTTEVENVDEEYDYMNEEPLEVEKEDEEDEIDYCD